MVSQIMHGLYKCMVYAAKPFLHLLKVFVRRYGILRHLRFTRSVSGYELMHGPVLVLYMINYML